MAKETNLERLIELADELLRTNDKDLFAEAGPERTAASEARQLAEGLTKAEAAADLRLSRLMEENVEGDQLNLFRAMQPVLETVEYERQNAIIALMMHSKQIPHNQKMREDIHRQLDTSDRLLEMVKAFSRI